MTDLNNRRAGLLFGSFSAEALSLGVHWIYDPQELVREHGRVTHYKAPGDWLGMWPTYDDYVDKATKATLANLQNGVGTTDAGSESDEIAGPARIAPLVAFLAESTEDEIVRAAVEQTRLTHRSPEAEQAATFLAKASYRILHGASLGDTIRETAPDWALKAAAKVLPLRAVEAIGKLGRTCPIPAALPSVIYLALKHGETTETAFIENAMAGGDNCARALALGMLLGAANGIDSIPENLRNDLRAAADLYALIESNSLLV